MNQGQDFFPHADIPDSNVFPGGTFEFEFSSLEDGYSNNSGKRMLKAQFTCVQPPNLAGMSHWENFVCGTDTNLKDINPAAMGTRNLKQAMNAAQIPANNSVAQICALVNQSKPHLMVTLSYYQEKDGEYAGQDRNRVVGYDKLGARPVQILTAVGGTGGSGAPVVSGAPAPQMPPMGAAPAAMPPTTPPPVQAPPQMMQQQPMQAPAPPQQMAPLQPTQPQPTTATGLTASPPPPPVQAPAQTQAPPAPPMAAQAPAPQQMPAPQALPQTPAAANANAILCTICGQQVSADQYESHVYAHAEQNRQQ